MNKSLVSIIIVLLFKFTISAQTPMTLTFNTQISSGQTISLPLSGSVNVSIDWGDGTNENVIVSGIIDHTYSSPGIYIVSITGQVSHFGNGFNSYPNAEKLVSVTDFGDLGITNLSGAFYGAKNLSSVPAQIPSGVTNLSYMFKGDSVFNSDIGTWDVSNVTNMNQMFQGAVSFNQNIGSWNVNYVTSMNYMFTGASAFNQDIGNWYTENVTSMYFMFSLATAFNQDIGNWNVSNVTDMGGMFWAASAFNQNIGNWNVSNVQYMDEMFLNAVAFNQDISNWNVSSVTSMNKMFTGANAFNQDIGNWNVSNVTNMSEMFSFATSFNQNIGNWNVSIVTNMKEMFYFASDFNQNLAAWDIRNVTDMSGIFQNSALSSLNYSNMLSSWYLLPLQMNVSFHAGNAKYAAGIPAFARQSIINNFNWNITDGGPETSTPMELIFNTQLSSGTTITLPLLGNVYVSIDWGDGSSEVATTIGLLSHTYSTEGIYHVLVSGTLSQFGNGSAIYPNAEKLTQVVQFGTIGLTSLSGAFTGAVNLTSVPTQLPSTVSDLSYMFCNALSFNMNIALWNTGNITNMENLFENAGSFNQNILGWNVSNVVSMKSMFKNATTFNQYIAGWNVSQVSNMNSMFYNALSFNRNLGNWNVAQVADMDSMFYGITLSTSNYSGILSGWSALPLQNNVVFHAGGSKYYAGNPTSAKQNIINNFNWTITDGGQEPVETRMILKFNTQLSSGLSVTLPLMGTINVSIDWGDGNTENFISSGLKSHTYDADGIYEIFISGSLSTFGSGASVCPNIEKLIAVYSFGTLGLTSLNGAFKGAVNLTEVPELLPETVTILSRTFSGATSFNQDIGNWDVSHVTDMNKLFEGASLFNQGIGNWNTANVLNMSDLFYDATAFNQPIGNWNTGSVTNMLYMFGNASAFNQDIGNWNVSNVTNMGYMFNNATSFNQTLENWNVSNVTLMGGMFYNATAFNQPIGSWNTGNVTTMGNMFYNAPFFNHDIGNWNTGNVINMSNMFRSATSFNQNINNWNVEKVTNMSYMFWKDTVFNQPIGNWNTGLVTNMSYMFYEAKAFNQPIGNWNTANVTNMSYMFYKAFSFNQNIETWNTGNVANMSYMFNWATGFNQPLGNWDVSKVTTMTYIFSNASAFNQPLDNWNTGLVTNMNNMFSGALTFNQNLETWNVGSVTNMSRMFYGARAFNGIIGAWNVSAVTDMELMFFLNDYFNQDIGLWNVGNVTNMQSMFNSAIAFNKDIGNWNTLNVINMSSMFSNAGSFNQNINNWNVSNVTNMAGMFSSTISFNQPLNNWNVGKVTNMNNIFSYAINFNQDLGAWDVGMVTSMYKMFSNAVLFNQNLSNWNVELVSNMNFMFYNAVQFNQNLGYWNVTNVAGMDSMLYGVTLLTENYDSMLVSWSALTLKNDVKFHAGESKFHSGVPAIAKQNIINNFNWTITDGGEETVSLMSLNFDTQNSEPATITLPLFGQVNVTIDWGDGNSESVTSPGLIHHTYTSKSLKTVSINGFLEQFGNGSTGYPNAEKLVQVNSFGNIGLSSLAGAFKNAVNLIFVPLILPENITNLSYAFSGTVLFNQDISGWDVSNVVAMDSMLYGVTLSTQNYNNLLTAWSELSLQNNVVLHAGNSRYSDGVPASSRQYIIENFNWTIYDGGIIDTAHIYETVALGDTVILQISTPVGTIQWQESNDSIQWADMQGYIDTIAIVTTTISPTNLKFYRAVVTDSTCMNIPTSISNIIRHKIIADKSALQIGDFFKGGIIFQTTGYGQGLSAPKADQSFGIEWGCSGISIAEASSLEDGALNTDAILSDCSTRPIAASICSDLILNGYDDWVLPAANQLSFLYQNNNHVGGFSTDNYWTSSELDSENAYVINFASGIQSMSDKSSSTNAIRCIRKYYPNQPTISTAILQDKPVAVNIFDQPEAQNICQGEDIIFSISTVGTLPVSYQWKKNGTIISGATDSIFSLSNSNISMEGQYSCEVSNICRSLVSNQTECNIIYLLLNAGADKTICEETSTTINATCISNHANLSGNLSYNWLPSYGLSENTVQEPVASPDSTTTYYATVTDELGCTSSDSITITVQNPYDNEVICMVTVDEMAGKNKIVWNKTYNQGTNTYIIYKENLSGDYVIAGNVLFGDTSVFIDLASTPELKNEKYKIALIDTCMNESEFSPFHQSIFLSISEGSQPGFITLQWNPYIDQSGIYSPSFYSVYKGISPSNMSLLTTVPENINSYNDSIFAEVNYYKIVFDNDCGTLLTANSNMVDNSIYVSNFAHENNSTARFNISPNPFSDKTCISFNNPDNKKLKIVLKNTKGCIARDCGQTKGGQIFIEKSDLKPGMYFIEIIGSDILFREKIIIE